MNKKSHIGSFVCNVGLSFSSFRHHGCRDHEAGGRNEINDAITFLSNCTPCKFPPKRMEHDSHSASELSTTGGKIPGLKAMGRLGAKSTLPRSTIQKMGDFGTLLRG